MRNTVSNVSLAIFLLASVFSSYAAERLVPLSKQGLDRKKIDRALEKISANLPNGLSVKVFKERSFYLRRSDTEVIAGEMFGGAMGRQNECFVYIKSKRKEGKIFKISQKADKLWHCAGEPIFEAKSIGARSDLLILGMYLFQAPAGDSFYLPQVIEVTADGKAHIGDIDHCVDKKTDGEAVVSMNELSKIAAKCFIKPGT